VSVLLARNRRVIEECFLWANQRRAFQGRKLLDQPVIRYKLGDMISQNEACFALFERVIHLFNTSSLDQRAQLGGITAFLKFRATRTATAIADHASQIVGGRAVTRSGPGKLVERFARSYKQVSIFGGSEEVLVDLGVRQAVKLLPHNARL